MNNILSFLKKVTSVEFLPRWFVFVFDLICTSVAFFVANSLLSGIGVKDVFSQQFFWRLVIYLFVNVVYFVVFKVCIGVIRHSTFTDFLRIIYSQVASFFTLVIISYSFLYFDGEKMFLTTRILLSSIFTIFIITIYRLAVKTVFQQLSLKPAEEKKNLLIYGIGPKAIGIANVLVNDTNSPYRIKALFERSDRDKSMKELGNIPIITSKRKVYVIARKLKCEYVLLADENLTTKDKKRIVDRCLDYGIKVLYFPDITDWSDHKKVIDNIKRIRIEDLLERKEIKISNAKISEDLRGKTIMVTGAAGSIGSEIVTQVLKFSPAKLLLVDQAETLLHTTNLNIAEKNHKETEIIPIIGDVRDLTQMEEVISKYRPEFIYHAAAYKHVPLMEKNPFQAVFTNVMGTKNMADLASKYQVDRFVMVSTDKAVNPSNVMGASKRIAEKYVLALSNESQNNTKFITTRFGNVLGSNGSVVPLFTKQIEAGGPLTITHPDIIRYFMTIPEACQLVLEAGSMGKGGEVFVFDMGEPVKIINLAKKMIKLAGLTPGVDIEIKEIGLREGEKLYEELLYDTAQSLPTHHKKIMIASDIADNFIEISDSINNLIIFAKSNQLEQTIIQMKKIVPEYKSLNSEYEKYD